MSGKGVLFTAVTEDDVEVGSSDYRSGDGKGTNWLESTCAFLLHD